MTTDTKEFIITRTFNAPREQVWTAWTDILLFDIKPLGSLFPLFPGKV